MATPDPEAVGDRRRARYGLLLLLLFGAFFVEGTTGSNEIPRAVVTVMLAGTLLLAFWAGDMRPQYLRIAAVIAGAVVVATIVALLAASSKTVNGITGIVNAIFVLLAPASIVVTFVRGGRGVREVTIEAVFSALCLYILAGMFFAALYGAIDNLGGDPFFANGEAATPARCLYFSFTTLTTIGYGDFTARTDLGHTLAAFEGLLGQIYLVTVVSVIVANLVPRRVRGSRS